MLLPAFASAADDPPVPVIVKDWWQVAGNSDSSPHSEVVDHCFWTASDGKWRLWTQIRDTENGRIFSQWAGGARLNDQWRLSSELWQGEEKHGETPGVVQAPHVYKADGTYHMTYGGGGQICLATSQDGVMFRRHQSPSRLISELKNRTPSGIRDPYMTKIGDSYRIYYTKDDTVAMVEADRPDSQVWSTPIVVYREKTSRTQCPTVIQHADWFYLFCMGGSGEYQTQVLASKDPDDFGVDSGKQITVLQTSASEIIRDGSKWYISSLVPIRNDNGNVIKHGGVRLAPFNWVYK
ncbi:Glycosyl hydrolases family 43 [Rosistilla ulvae]|uniref:Glycosyl hydrolases family 43 n=2 Tax=Rosistilla ulvae TaxID=1930277 RepID=A0A517LX36_9BACT|nr:Glycosyl hydrolases family 43 [Rosistilla ulvae]